MRKFEFWVWLLSVIKGWLKYLYQETTFRAEHFLFSWNFRSRDVLVNMIFLISCRKNDTTGYDRENLSKTRNSQKRKISVPTSLSHKSTTKMNWRCFYYFVRNSLVALLKTICARKLLDSRFVLPDSGTQTEFLIRTHSTLLNQTYLQLE